MYHIKNDRRSVRSAQLLYDALGRLMQQKPFKTISVTDLVQAAQIGRTTFYRNFDEIEDILWLKCDQTFDAFISYARDALQRQQTETRIVLLKPLLQFFDHHSEIIELLIFANRLDMIQDSFRARMQPLKSQIAALHGVEEIYADYSISIRLGVMTNILIHWIKTGKKEAPDELADTLGHMISRMATFDELL